MNSFVKVSFSDFEIVHFTLICNSRTQSNEKSTSWRNFERSMGMGESMVHIFQTYHTNGLTPQTAWLHKQLDSTNGSTPQTAWLHKQERLQRQRPHLQREEKYPGIEKEFGFISMVFFHKWRLLHGNEARMLFNQNGRQ